MVTIEEEILSLFHQGYTAKQIMEMNYKKSTVYKVSNDFKTFSGQVRKPLWKIENIIFDHPNCRYFPGNIVNVNFEIVNYSIHDLYILSVGIQTEWMIKENIWTSQVLKDLLKPKQRSRIKLSFQIPYDIPFGEYELLFGLEGEYLPTQGYNESPLCPIWTEPLVLHVKYPLIHETVFLSHSVKDIYLVRELEKYLDNYGILVIIGEDHQLPGHILEEKFKKMIFNSSIFLALVTDNAIRSEMVRKEINDAIETNKPKILLKESSVKLKWDAEWVSFSKNQSPLEIFQIIMLAIQNLQEKGEVRDSPLIGMLLIAVVAFLIGWGLRK